MFLCSYWFFISENGLNVDAYYLDNNGNIQSSNLWSLNSTYSNSSSGYILYGNEFSLTSGTYTFSFNFSGSSAASDFRLYTLYEDQPVYDKVFTVVNGLNSFTFTINSSTTKILWYSNATGSYSNLILNTGSTRLNYEPYGTWYSSNIANQPLNIAFNGCQVDLLTFSNNTYNVVDSTNLTFGDSNVITLDNIPYLKNIIDNDEDTKYGLKFYLNNPINSILNFQMNNTVYQVKVTLSNSVTGESYNFENTGDGYNLVCSTNSNYYDTILYYSLLSPDYNYFSMYVNTDTASFNNGYDVGYYDGYNDGYDNGHRTGYNTGYNNGKGDGISIGSDNTNTLYGMVIAVVDAPINIFKDIFDFNILGINIAGVVFGIVSLLIIIWLIKKML